jgi:hypothetical protein
MEISLTGRGLQASSAHTTDEGMWWLTGFLCDQRLAMMAAAVVTTSTRVAAAGMAAGVKVFLGRFGCFEAAPGSFVASERLLGIVAAIEEMGPA